MISLGDFWCHEPSHNRTTFLTCEARDSLPVRLSKKDRSEDHNSTPWLFNCESHDAASSSIASNWFNIKCCNPCRPSRLKSRWFIQKYLGQIDSIPCVFYTGIGTFPFPRSTAVLSARIPCIGSFGHEMGICEGWLDLLLS